MGARANWDADTQGHTWPAQVAAQGPTGPGELGGSTHPGWACWPRPRHMGWPSARCWGLRPGCPRPGSSLGPLPPLCMAGPEGSCAWPSRGSRPALEDGPQAERGAGPRPEHRPLRCLRFVDVSVTVPGLRASCGGPSGRTRACTWPLNTEGMRDGDVVAMVPGQVQLGASCCEASWRPAAGHVDSSQEACVESLAPPTWRWALECDPSWPGPPAGSKNTGTGLRARTWPALLLPQLTMDSPQSPPGLRLSPCPLQTPVFSPIDPSQKRLWKGILTQ